MLKKPTTFDLKTFFAKQKITKINKINPITDGILSAKSIGRPSFSNNPTPK